MICMAGLQVFIVRFFFQGARKGEFSYIGGIGRWREQRIRADLFNRVCMKFRDSEKP